MAIYPEFAGAAKAGRDRAVDKMLAKAKIEMGLPESELIVRQLRPEDTTLVTSHWGTVNITSANSFTDLVTAGTIADNRYISIYGHYNAEGSGELIEVRVTRSGSTARFWDLTSVRSWRHATAWFDDPVTIDQNTTITISYSARSASTIVDFCPVGDVVEKRGLLVNP